MEEKWTTEKVRAELPDVKVKWNEEIYTAHTSGRLNRFCSVAPFVEKQWYRVDGNKDVKFGEPMLSYIGVRFEFSWETVARSLNTGSVLIV